MVLAGCLTTDEAYEALDWRILFLLAGMLALGAAMDSSGAAKLLAERIVTGIGWMGPVAVLSALYLLTSILTEVMTNNAAVVLLAPIAIASAEALGLNARPLLVADHVRGLIELHDARGLPNQHDDLRPGALPLRGFLEGRRPLEHPVLDPGDLRDTAIFPLALSRRTRANGRGHEQRSLGRLRGERILIATGSSPFRPPLFPYGAAASCELKTSSTLRRAKRLSSASTSVQGAYSVLVRSIISWA